VCAPPVNTTEQTKVAKNTKVNIHQDPVIFVPFAVFVIFVVTFLTAEGRAARYR
jgi:hypothetical protein